MLYPLTFEPLLMERVWGGRRLEELYGKRLPEGRPIGESWEITDRPGAVSVIANGALAGRSLRWLMEHHAAELFGPNSPGATGPFPWLIKILDAQDKLSLQVHPPAEIAAELGGEPKTEMWYVAAATPEAEIFAGLRRGVTRAEFEQRTTAGTVADCFHRIRVKPGDCMFLRSGRVHALGAGSVIFEIQQNSDTTFRVFDWNRLGLDGRPRELHVEKSLRSIDFNDFEPELVPSRSEATAFGTIRDLVDDELFRVSEVLLHPEGAMSADPNVLQVIGVLSGTVEVQSPAGGMTREAGQFALIPGCLSGVTVRAAGGGSAGLLWVRPGS